MMSRTSLFKSLCCQFSVLVSWLAISWTNAATAQSPEAGGSAPPAPAAAKDDLVENPGAVLTKDAPDKDGEALFGRKKDLKGATVARAPGTCSVEHEGSGDWVRLSSGEWLTGSVKRMRDDTLEFSSDVLGDVELDWKSGVVELCSKRQYIYTMDNKRAYDGVGHIDSSEVIVTGGKKKSDAAFPRLRLLSIIAGPPKEISYWSSKINFGLSLREGNSSQLTTNTTIKIEREDAWTRLHLMYQNMFGKAEGVQIAKSHYGELKFDVFVTKLFYVTPVFLNVLNDPFQNIDVRLQTGSGIGVHLFDRDRMWWDAETGIGYQYLNLDSALPDEENPRHDGLVRLGTLFGFELSKVSDFELSWFTFLTFTDIDRTSHRGTATLSNNVLDDYLDLDVTFIYQRQEGPLPDAAGVTPKKNDYGLVLSVGLDLG